MKSSKQARSARVSPALVVAMLALLVALTGTAVATTGAVVTGKQIVNGSITGADVKDKSLRPADFRGSLRGPRGPQGATGLQGPQGPAGVAGPKGDKGETGDDGQNLTIDSTLPPLKTLVGVWATDRVHSVTFQQRLAANIPPANHHYIGIGDPKPAACQGTWTTPTAAPGHLCVYAAWEFDVTFGSFAQADLSRLGFTLNLAGAQADARGSWAVTAPLTISLP